MWGILSTFAWTLLRLLLHVVYYPILVFLWALFLCVLLGSAREFLETTMVDPPAQKRLHDLLQQLFSDRQQMGEVGDLPASSWRGWEHQQHQQQQLGHHHPSLSNPSGGGAHHHHHSQGVGGSLAGLSRAQVFFTSRRRMVALLVAVGVGVLYLVLSTHRLPALLRATLDWRVWLSVYRGTSGVVVGGGKAVRVLFTPSTFAWVLKWRWEAILLALLSPALAWVALSPSNRVGGKSINGGVAVVLAALGRAKGGAHPHHEHAASAPSRPPFNTSTSAPLPATSSLPPFKEEESGGISSAPSTPSARGGGGSGSSAHPHQTPPSTPLPPIYTPHSNHTGLHNHQHQHQQPQQKQQFNQHQDTLSVATDSPGSLTFSITKSVGGGSVGTAGGGKAGGGGVKGSKEGGGEEEGRRKAALLRAHARNERRISLLRNVAQRACVTLEEVARSTPLRGGGY